MSPARIAPLLAAPLSMAFAAPAPPRPAPAPWLGTWSLRLPAPGGGPETLIYSDAGGGAMRMVSVEEGSEIVTRFDGRPAPVAGPGGLRTLAIRAVSPTRYRWTFSVAGEPRVRGINTLAADRRSFTEVSWSVADPARRVTLVYDRR